MSSNTSPHALRALAVVAAIVIVASAFAPMLGLASRVMS